MSTTQAVTTITVPANAASTQFLVGAINATGRYAVNTVSGAHCDGVCANKPLLQDDATELQVAGLVKATAGAAITPGAEVMADGTGKLITATTTNEVFGIYKGAAACANGDIIQVLVTKYHKV